MHCRIDLIRLALHSVPLLCATLLGGSALSTAWADQFTLSSGGQLEGELVNSEQENPARLEIRTAGGGRIVLAASQVTNAKLLSPEERAYRQLLPKMPDTIEGMWKMAEWCREQGLDEQRKFHLEQIIERDKDHKGARAGLGYTSTLDGRWIITDQWQARQGKIRHGARWLLPQEILLDQQADNFEDREIEWKRNVKRWRNQLDRRRGAEALKELRSADDPAAATAYAEALAEEPNRDLRKLYIGVLGRMTTSSVATTALAKHALNDNDEQVRDAALDQLVRNKVNSAVNTFIRALEDDSNLLVNRAAIGLSRMGDRRAIVPLIDALITEHKQVIRSGGGPGQLGASFGGGGAGGLSVGGSTKVRQSRRQNVAVYQALVTLTGANFLYNEQAWRRWYAQENTPEFVNLRRDQ